MDNHNDRLADQAGPPMPSEAELRTALLRSEADLAAGRLVPMEDVLADLKAAAGRVEARRRARQA